MRCLAFLVALVLSPVSEPPPPPATQELEKLQPLVGAWQGSGGIHSPTGANDRPWTATMEADWSLGGHFLEALLEIRVPSPFQQRRLIGRDAENERFVTLIVTNEGHGGISQLHWEDGETLVWGGSAVFAGRPYWDRAIWRLREGGFAVVKEEAVGSGPWRVYADGDMARVEKLGARGSETIFPTKTVGDEMRRAGRMAGEYELRATVAAGPGRPSTTFAARITVRPIFEGIVLEFRVAAASRQGAPYEAVGYLLWREADRCHALLSGDDRGVVREARGQWLGSDRFVLTSHATEGGRPVLSRAIIHVGDEGITELTVDVIRGDAAPMRSLSATLTPVAAP